jgi:hypothetical protein
MTIRRVGDLDIAEDPGLDRRTWTVERAGWAVMLLVVAAALLGLCGSTGPLNAASAGDGDGALAVSYARLLRHGSPTSIEVRLGSGAAADGAIRLSMDTALFDHLQVEAVTPEPDRMELQPGRVLYVFPVAADGEDLTVTFDMLPTRYGPHTVRMAVGDGPPVQFRQFVYP